jgi:hypothetical protein
MDGSMPEYRFYTVSKDGHISAQPIVSLAPDDSAAAAEAKQFLDDQDIEVRQGLRVVAYLVPDKKK